MKRKNCIGFCINVLVVFFAVCLCASCSLGGSLNDVKGKLPVKVDPNDVLKKFEITAEGSACTISKAKPGLTMEAAKEGTITFTLFEKGDYVYISDTHVELKSEAGIEFAVSRFGAEPAFSEILYSPYDEGFINNDIIWLRIIMPEEKMIYYKFKVKLIVPVYEDVLRKFEISIDDFEGETVAGNVSKAKSGNTMETAEEGHIIFSVSSNSSSIESFFIRSVYVDLKTGSSVKYAINDGNWIDNIANADLTLSANNTVWLRIITPEDTEVFYMFIVSIVHLKV